MKVVLINPNFRDLVARVELFLTTPFTLPLGLAYLAAYLEAHGHEVMAIDAHAENLSLAALARRVKTFSPAVAGFSAHSSARHCAIAAARIKRALPDVTTVMGGVVPSLLPEAALKSYPSIDFLIHGEGEIPFLELVAALGHGGVDDVRGIGLRRDGTVIINPAGDVVRDLDSLPLPARRLFPNRLYRYWPRLPGNVETLIAASRGCSAGNCGFCCIGKMFGNHVRQRNPGKVAAEIEQCLSGQGIRNFSFIDSTFTHDRAFVIAIADEIEKRGLQSRIRWWCSTRVDRIDADLLNRMKGAGCVAVSYGVESGSQRVLDSFNKRISLSDTEKAFALTREAGLWTTAYVMINQYTPDFRDRVRETSAFLLRIKPDLLRVSPLIVNPGSGPYESLRAAGAFRETDNQPCLEGGYIESAYVGRRELERIKRGMYLGYYARRKFLLPFAGNRAGLR